ncbi:MAG: hypothetical protein HOP29_07535 [Phycisphaerales bacterium]|nr:hypothetical protein [Phycisphaerales bacterium]
MATVTTVQLQPPVPPPDSDAFTVFFEAVRAATNSLAYPHFSNFITSIFCTDDASALSPRLQDGRDHVKSELGADHFQFRGSIAYEQIREAADIFVACQAALLEDCCNGPAKRKPRREFLVKEDLERASRPEPSFESTAAAVSYSPLLMTECSRAEIERRFSPQSVDLCLLRALVDRLFDPPQSNAGTCCTMSGDAEAIKRARGGVSAGSEDLDQVLTFMQQLRGNQQDVPIKEYGLGSGNCTGILRSKLRCPPMLELIWSYWIEQGMLVQGLNALSLRFQNRRPVGPDPLTRCDLSPLRPLNNIFWGYIQREQDRLTVVRRAYEYDHHYGLKLDGRAVPPLVPADSRSSFVEAFHRLLQLADRYYRTAMNTTMNANAFPILNAIRDLHLTLAEGAHNQFGDLPSTARAEMLVQQWLLARPEMREFLGGRPGVPYPEAWMPHMETLRNTMGWNDTTIRHYRDLADYGEKLLLTIRYLPWSQVNNSLLAALWLTFWRPEIESYVHSYRIVTGVDLTIDDVRIQPPGMLAAQPSDLIRRRRAAQMGAMSA